MYYEVKDERTPVWMFSPYNPCHRNQILILILRYRSIGYYPHIYVASCSTKQFLSVWYVVQDARNRFEIKEEVVGRKSQKKKIVGLAQVLTAGGLLCLSKKKKNDRIKPPFSGFYQQHHIYSETFLVSSFPTTGCCLRCIVHSVH